MTNKTSFMINHLLIRIATPFILAILLIPAYSYSQKIHTGKEALSMYSDVKMVRESRLSELPSYIAFQNGKEKDVDAIFLWIKKNFQLSTTVGFELIKKETDKLGFIHYRFQQTFSNTPIEGAVWILHTKNDKVVSMNGLLYANLTNSGSSSINENQALDFALTHVGAEIYKWELPSEEKHIKWVSEDENATHFPKGEKIYVANHYNYNSSNYRLAYKFTIYAHEPLYKADVYVDATNGNILSENSIIKNIDAVGTASTAYSGTQTITTDDTGSSFRLQETGRGNGIRTFDLNESTSYGGAVDFTDTDNNWNNVNAELDEYATDAHWGAEMTYDYLMNVHGRNSIDGNGFRLDSYVHYGASFNNAFWDGNQMTYGDGNSAPFTALDIAGHEISHGLTTFTANLVYQAESGALNESFSDIIGTSVENYARPTNWNWTVGEDLGGAFRSMSDPNAYGDPDTYFGNNWASLTGGDNGGVHTNSSIQNYWYYLLTIGDSGTNDNGDAYNITGLGFASSSAIAFRNLTVYLTSNSEFSDARFYAIQSAMDLFGACTPEVEQTTNAWYAVGVGAMYNPTVAANFSAPTTSSCSAPFTVDFSNASNNASNFNWNFGDGNTSTQMSPSHTYTTAGTYDVQLTADGGSCGSDVVTFTAYIDIDAANPCIVTFPTSGNGDTQTACSGTIYDSGGASANYGANQDAQITISPTGAATVDINFSFFDIEPGTGSSCDYDYIDVYDGANTGAPLIGKYCNNNIPTTLSSTGGSITIVFHSDPGLELAGFQLDWTCNLPTTPPTADFLSNVTTSCTGEITFLDQSINGPDTWSWDFGDGNSSSQQNPSHTYTANGTYTVTLTSSNTNGSDVNTKTNYIVVNMPIAPSTTDDNICENNTATLSANGTNTINWYDAATGGNLVNTGTSYTTPTLTNTTSYYVEEEIPAVIQNVGPTDNTFGTGGYYTGDQYLLFDCSIPFTLLSVWVDANGAGSRTIELRDNVGTVLQTTTVNVPDGQSRVILNFDVQPGNDLQLGTLAGSNPDTYRNDASASYPYDIAGIVSITSSSAGGAYYYHFYDWEIQEYSCKSARTQVTANVSPTADATISPVAAACENDSPITMTAVDAGGTWSGTGITGSSFSPTTAGTGTHTITYSISGTCGDMDTYAIIVNENPDANFTSATTLCINNGIETFTPTTSGGTWSADCSSCINSSTGEFDPSTAGVGTWSVDYTVTSGSSCTSTTIASVIVDNCSGIDLVEASSLLLYPNPANEQVTISTGAISNGVISITDLLGKEIITIQYNSSVTTIDVSNKLSRGNYFVRIFSSEGNTIAIKKLVKN